MGVAKRPPAIEGFTMLNVNVQECGDATVLRCDGQIVAGDESMILRAAVVTNSNSKRVVLDLAEVDRVDAGGLGLMLQLVLWTRSRGVELKLMNLASRVERFFKLVRVDRVFTTCSAEEINGLCSRAADLEPAGPGQAALFQLAFVDL
jgi:anti-anti-sigma factor